MLKLPLGLFIIFEYALPIGAVLYLLFGEWGLTWVVSPYLEIIRLLHVFLVLPIYAVYGWILIQAQFPRVPREAWQLLVPTVLSMILTALIWPQDGWRLLLLLESLPIYLGQILLFVLGFCGLVKQQKSLDSLGAIVVFIGLLSLVLLPTLGVFIQGLELSFEPAYPWLTLGEYFLIIGASIWFQLPLLKQLYAEGAL